MNFNPIKLWEEVRELAKRNEDLRDEFYATDLKVQHICSDTGYKWWVHLKENFEFGEGEMEHNGCELTATQEMWEKMLAGEIKGGRAWVEKKLKIEGDFQDSIEYGGFLKVLKCIQEEDAEENANQKTN